MSTIQTSLLDDICKALALQKREKSFPDHIVARAGMVSEAAGNLLNSSIDVKYDNNVGGNWKEAQRDKMRDDAVQLVAIGIRFLQSLEKETSYETHSF